MLTRSQLTRRSVCRSILAVAVAGTMSTQAQAVWINSILFNVDVNNGAGSGKVKFNNYDYPFVMRGVPIDQRSGTSFMQAFGEVYFLVDIGQFQGTYRRIEENVPMVSITGVSGGIKLVNQNNIVMFLYGPNNNTRFDPNIQVIEVELVK